MARIIRKPVKTRVTKPPPRPLGQRGVVTLRKKPVNKPDFTTPEGREAFRKSRAKPDFRKPKKIRVGRHKEPELVLRIGGKDIKASSIL